MHWQSLAFFNLFRLLSVVVLLLGGFFFSSSLNTSADKYPFFIVTCFGYSLLGLLFALGIKWRKPSFDVQLAIHVAVDVYFIASLMYALGGLNTGLGLLMLPYLAAAGLMARGRMTLFHAALATVVLLLEESYRIVIDDVRDYNYTTLALLCIACFAVAWLAHRLARAAQESQKLAEQRKIDLNKLDQLNQRILQDVSDGVLVVDAKGRIRQFNTQAQRLTGWHPYSGSRLRDFLPALANGLSHWREDPMLNAELVEAPLTRKLLRPRFVALEEGYDGAALVYLEDMDKLRREAQQIKLAALGRLTANLAHEIRNPLGAISHAAELLREESRDPLIDKLTRIIGENSERLDRMVKDVLELNRRDRLQRVDVRLAGWLNGFLEEFVQVEKIGLHPALFCPEEALIRFDRGHLHQVLWNLTRNGWRYCSKGEHSLQLHVSLNQGRWQLDICNDGPPVPAEVQAQLFEPFFTTDARGTGLGLYIAREICQANSAHIEYIAPDEGGACFRITFGVNNGQKAEQNQ